MVFGRIDAAAIMVADAPLAQRQVLTPSALANAVRSLLEQGLPLLWLSGELSNVLRAKSGHVYFTVKDAGAQIRCAMFRPRALHLRFEPRDGQQVLLRGRVTLYEPRGDFQLQVEHMEPGGLGELQRQFDELKARLDAEGLFALARKRPLGAMPRRIAVISSPSGAAIRDVLAVITRRFALVEIDLFPSLVQGSEAPAQLLRALRAADTSGHYDSILLTRGGGSMEDLWAFNDEALVRAIAACRTPVVAAIGHEIDTTLAELAADLRAATPSAAAELLVPDRFALARRLQQRLEQLQISQHRRLERAGQRADHAQLRLRAQHPLRRLQTQQQSLDKIQRRLAVLGHGFSVARAQRLRGLRVRLDLQHPAAVLRQRSDRLHDLHRRLQAGVVATLSQNTRQLAALARTLNAVSPLATLDRGYAIAFDQHGRTLRSNAALQTGDPIRVRLKEGEFTANVTRTHPLDGR